MNNTPDPFNEERLTRWIDGQLSPDELAVVERELASQPEWLREKESANQLGDFLRAHLPARQEPESPDFFTSRIMAEIGSADQVTAPVAPPAAPSLWHRFLATPWFAPVASAAAVAIGFLVLNTPRPAATSSGAEVARTYTPDPNVTARAYYSDAAEAIVIDLVGLEAVPDDREIKAFDLASAAPAEPGRASVYYAATDPERAVMVLSPRNGTAPAIRALR